MTDFEMNAINVANVFLLRLGIENKGNRYCYANEIFDNKLG